MRTIFILGVLFLVLTSFDTANNKSTNEQSINKVYVKYSNGDITGLSGYTLLDRVEKELKCDFFENENLGTCPYNKICINHSECLEYTDTLCICFNNGCECSLTGVCLELFY